MQKDRRCIIESGSLAFSNKTKSSGARHKNEKKRKKLEDLGVFRGGVDLSIKWLKPPHVILPSAERGRN